MWVLGSHSPKGKGVGCWVPSPEVLKSETRLRSPNMFPEVGQHQLLVPLAGVKLCSSLPYESFGTPGLLGSFLSPLFLGPRTTTLEYVLNREGTS